VVVCIESDAVGDVVGMDKKEKTVTLSKYI
jgi:hypothetical protein